jgi:DnaJ-class molecular chaperone
VWVVLGQVGLKDALVGFATTIKHVDEREVKLNKEDVTHWGEIQRVKGQGMPKKGGSGFGDMVVKWEVRRPSGGAANPNPKETLTACSVVGLNTQVEFPKTLTADQKKELKRVLA